MLTLAEGILERTFEQLRACGAGRAECVVHWSGPLAQPGRVDAVVHPRHMASAGGYELDPAWIGELWLELAANERTVRAQVHTHPGAAFHSSLDDRYALVHTAGYYSLVIPGFALGPVGLAGSYLAARRSDGGWRREDPVDAIAIAP